MFPQFAPFSILIFGPADALIELAWPRPADQVRALERVGERVHLSSSPRAHLSATRAEERAPESGRRAGQVARGQKALSSGVCFSLCWFRATTTTTTSDIRQSNATADLNGARHHHSKLATNWLCPWRRARLFAQTASGRLVCALSPRISS